MSDGPLARLGSAVEARLAAIGRQSQLAASAAERTLVGPWRGERFRWRETLQEIHRAGNASLPLVGLISVLVGMILALQSAYQLQQLGAERLVAQLVAVSVTRELAPLLTAILVAGRVGSSISAELGTMKVSQEVDALTVMGIDPISSLVVPRLMGLAVAVPCLTLFADVVGILGGGLVATGILGQSASGYLADSINALQLEDIWGSVLKALTFGAIIGLVACHQGLETRGGSGEVGRSTTAAVVRSIVWIIIADLFVTAVLYLRH
ncbi:MAG: ABC transporter permease [Acidobacteriota bacterium]